MKMRRHKHFVQVRLWINTCNRYWQRRIDEMLTLTPEEQAERDAQHKAVIDQMFKDIGLGGLADEQPVYQCVKVNGGDFVAAFSTQAEALSLVLKHFRQKKAKLMVMHNGEPVLFEEALA